MTTFQGVGNGVRAGNPERVRRVLQPPEASLGSLIAEGAAQINPIRIYWWMIVLPGFTLTSTLLALYFHGDGLRDAWDPQTGSE